MSLRKKWLQNQKLISNNGIDHTKSTYFLMPMLGYQKNDFVSHGTKDNFLINCHIDDLINPSLIIVLDNNKDVNLEMLLYKNDINSQFEGSALEEDGEQILLKYKLDSRYYSDFYKFIDGKFSEMSQTYKSRLIGLYGRKSNNQDHRPSIFDALYPTSSKRKQWADYLGVDVDMIKEVSSKPDMDYELFKSTEELIIDLDKKEIHEININNNI